MAADAFDESQNRETYGAFLKLSLYVLLHVTIILVGMMFGFILKMPVLGFGGMILGIIALTIYFLIVD